MPAISFRKFYRLSLLGLCLIVFVAAAENHVLGYMWRSATLVVMPKKGPENPHRDLQSSFDPVSDSLTILAVGDIVRCPLPDNLTKNFDALASLARQPVPLDRTKIGAVQTANLVENWPDAPILGLGDLVYRRGAPHEFADCFDPIWGHLRDRILPTPGNHEYYTPGAYAYYDYWAEKAGPERRGYYFVRAGNWLILSLNSEVDASPGSDQYLWLQEVLTLASEPCILGFYHRPAFSLQPRDQTENAKHLFAQLHKAGASVVLNGHNHFYERTHPLRADGTIDADDGTLSFVVGTGGGSLTADRDPVPTTHSAYFEHTGVLRLELRRDDFAWAFHSASANTVLDQGAQDCRRP